MKQRTVKIIFWIAVGTSVIVTMWFITELIKAGLINTSKYVSPEVSSNVGGFIGGVIGGILSFATLIILYYTYNSQLATTKDEKFRGSIELLMTMHESIVNDIRELEFTDENNFQHVGPISVVFYRRKTIGPDVFLDKLNYIINSYKLLTDECRKRISNNAESESADTAKTLLGRFYLSFYTKILWPILIDEHDYKGTIYKPYQTYLDISQTHDDSKHIFSNFSELAKEAFDYLNRYKLIALDNNKWKEDCLNKIERFKST